MTKSVDPPIPARVREHWHLVTVVTALRHAQCVGLLPWDARELTSLPRDVYRALLPAMARERERACTRELALGKRLPRIEQDLNAALWTVFQPWNRTREATPHSAAATPRQLSFGDGTHVENSRNPMPTR